MNRRKLLKTFGGGVSTLLWPEWSLAQERGIEEFTFVVVSDTHVGRANSMTPARQWANTAKEIEAGPGDFVLHLGDVVDSGQVEQYPVYLEGRRILRKPVHEVPGNHDPADAFAKHLTGRIDRSFDHKGVRFVLLNNSHTDSHDGFLDARQITWLGDQFTESAKLGLYLVVAMHVPVHTNRAPDRGWHVKPKEGQTAFYELVQRHRERVLALVHGHFHNGVRGWNDHGPLHEVVFPSALYNQNRNLEAAKAPGYYLSEQRPGYVRVTLRRAGMTLRYKPLGIDMVAERECAFAH